MISAAKANEDAGRPVKALTLTQPWATLVAIGAKRLETRSWPTSHRGLLAIHAANRFPGWARDLCVPGPGFARSPFYDALRAAGIRGPVRDRRRCSTGELPLGAVVAVCWLVDVREITSPDALGGPLGPDELAFGDYTLGRYAWFLEDITPLPEPISVRGAQRLWIWTPPPAAFAATAARSTRR